MKWTSSLIQTLRENPQDAEIDSHKLLVRAGLVKKNAAGLYSFLPLGMRTLKKIQTIIREEMDRTGAQEIVMPILQPAELWRKSGRWDTMGANMFKLRDRGEHEAALGPTAEEEVTSLVQSIVDSYRQLPLTVYQLQWKFRDETRPRFALMRSKEFLMKDAYSFDTDQESADLSYKKMYAAYERIFARCGLKAVPVEADGGDMGDSQTHEFHVLADAGEDGIAFCESCGYAANLERADRKVEQNIDATESPEVELISTPNVRTIDEVSRFLGEESTKFVKSLIYLADKKPIMVCVPGNREVNEVKLKRFLDAQTLELADNAIVQEITGASMGFVGPSALTNVRIVADLSLSRARGLIAGANKNDFHIKNLDFSRDVNIAEKDFASIAVVKTGDICPVCGKTIVIRRGIEVGQVFKLGTKYTSKFKAFYKDKDLQDHVIVMGCYGVGVSRTLQAIIEQSHDKDGIIWPSSVAPYQVVIENLDPKDENVSSVVNKLEEQLEAIGIDCIVDDRDERPGVKFKDADLIGFPVRVVVGAKSIANGGVEIKRRCDDKSQTAMVSIDMAIEKIKELTK